MSGKTKSKHDRRAPATESKRYAHADGRILFVGDGLSEGKSYMTLFRKTHGATIGLHRLKSPRLPERNSFEAAQRDLDAYASQHRLSEVFDDSGATAARRVSKKKAKLAAAPDHFGPPISDPWDDPADWPECPDPDRWQKHMQGFRHHIDAVLHAFRDWSIARKVLAEFLKFQAASLEKPKPCSPS